MSVTAWTDHREIQFTHYLLTWAGPDWMKTESPVLFCPSIECVTEAGLPWLNAGLWLVCIWDIGRALWAVLRHMPAPPVSTAVTIVTTLLPELLTGTTAVASCWAQQVRAWATAKAWEFPSVLCLAPTSWTGTWGGWWHPVAWPLLGGAGRMGGGWRGGICTGSRCPWAILGWMGTCPVPWPSFSVLRFAPVCWSGCTTNVWAVMLDLFAIVPIG